MPRTSTKKKPTAKAGQKNPFKLRKADKASRESERDAHVIAGGFRCDTDTRGHLRPRGRTPTEIVVDASEGFIPLWAKDMTLRWRFRESSLNFFESPAAARTAIRKLLGAAVLEWGSAAPVKFAERTDNWDFEIVMRKADDCDNNGCVLASAFFPDGGRHKLTIYPQMFSQSKKEQIETLAHEIGHVFGLRHFFADISETEWASEVFGKHDAFSIMNYGEKSKLTVQDQTDLKLLYQKVWSGALTEINGTPIRLVKPFHTIGSAPESIVAIAPLQPGVRPQPIAAEYLP
jgi:hypothetical protein